MSSQLTFAMRRLDLRKETLHCNKHCRQALPSLSRISSVDKFSLLAGGYLNRRLTTLRNPKYLAAGGDDSGTIRRSDPRDVRMSLSIHWCDEICGPPGVLQEVTSTL
jgi:hypothetical protein